jgi:hypothetical protein
MEQNRFFRAFALFVVLLAMAARLLPGPRTIDDAYITFRYARNLVAGEGLVYNPGERVLGTTTPLYAGLLAGIGLFAGGVEAPFPKIAMWVNASADAATCLVLLYIGRKFGVPLAGAAAGLVWSILPYSVTFAIGGLETSVFVLLLTATTACYLAERYTWAALLAGLAGLTRPDGALLVGPMVADRLVLAMRKAERVAITPREIAAFTLPVLGWVLPATIFYGSPIPQSIAAKTAAYLLPPEAAFTRLVQHYATPFMDNLTFGSAGIVAGLVLYPFLAAIGARRLLKKSGRIWPWLLFPWTWFLAFAIANPLIFRWYLAPPLPAYIFAILAGVDFILKDLRFSSGPGLRQYLAAGLLVILPAALVLRGWVRQPDHGPQLPAPDMAYIELELKYIEAAKYLEPVLSTTPGNPVLAAADIGALGYFTGAPILDTLGLISPEAAGYYPTRPEYYVNAYAVAPGLVLDERPEFIVLLEVYGREGLFKDPEFLAEYDLIHIVETDIYDSAGMLIFRRR